MLSDKQIIAMARQMGKPELTKARFVIDARLYIARWARGGIR